MTTREALSSAASASPPDALTSPLAETHQPPAGAPAGIDAVLAWAREGLDRVTAPQAMREALHGAVIVDTRPEFQRREHGEISPDVGALVVDRNVLEWRFDPRSGAALDVARLDLRLIVLCQQGYSSSLAAHTLREVGIFQATDVIGGFEAWRDAGLPVRAPRPY